MATTEEQAVQSLQQAYKLLAQYFEDEGGRGVDLANAIDHTGAAIRSLGYEPVLKE